MNKKGLVVVSLFNGMNTGRQALENEGILVDKYYSSEIKKPAIKLTQHHYPDTIQLGDIMNWNRWEIDWKSVDLVLSGSPCQDLSNAGQMKGIHGRKSNLFFVFVEILNHIRKLNPNVLFFQENVGGAHTKEIGIMSRELGVYPQRLDSKLFTGQLRDRYYWTNIKTKTSIFDVVTEIPLPKDRNIYFSDIIENGFVITKKAKALLQSEAKTFSYNDMDKFKKLYIRRIQEKRMKPNVVFSFVDRNVKEKEKLISKYKKEGFRKILFDLENNILDVRILTKVEMCRLQGFPDDYCDILSRTQAASLLGDGWSLPVIQEFFKYIK